MKIIGISILLFFIGTTEEIVAQAKTIEVKSFDKVIISPYIEVVFKEGTQETVTVEDINIPIEKLNIEVNNEVLHVYLDGARITSPTKKEKRNGWKQKVPIYKGTIAKITVTYKDVKTFALRGEEKIVFEDSLQQEECILNIYGESQIYIKEVIVDNLKVAIHGESYLEIMKGEVTGQKFTVYGEGKVNASSVKSKFTRITAYGDGDFQFNASEKMKITAYGEPTIIYSGSARLSKGLVIGEATIKKVSE
ncbi:DUF2807 domain-containing protein [Flavobacteriaceae bacterium R38]|nr:DUF2807 domain-containing protein [Flavobacteriaceae bacterium R38]